MRALAVIMLTALIFLTACSQEVPGAVKLVSGGGTTLSKAGAAAPREEPMDYATLRDAGSAARPQVLVNGRVYRPKADIVNILLLGVDKDTLRREVGRSDMIMLVTLDFEAGTIQCLTIPRDTHATVYQINESGNIVGEVYEKLNHAYAYGLGPNKYSAENAMLCTANFLNMGGEFEVPIDYYVSIDLDGIAELAGIFGGVDVTLDQDVPEVGKAGETVNLQGPTVRHYLQNRHDMSDGEVTRQLHEQTFLKALLEEIRAAGAVQNAPELYNMFTKFIRTNLTLSQVADYAELLERVSNDDIEFYRLSGTGTTEDGVWYLEPDMDEAKELVLKTQYVPA